MFQDTGLKDRIHSQSDGAIDALGVVTLSAVVIDNTCATGFLAAAAVASQAQVVTWLLALTHLDSNIG